MDARTSMAFEGFSPARLVQAGTDRRAGRGAGLSSVLVGVASLALAAVALATTDAPNRIAAAVSPSVLKEDVEPAAAAPPTRGARSAAETLGYTEVVFLPQMPMTVKEKVRLRAAPTTNGDAGRIVGAVDPGDRLRITRVVGGAADGPWLRVRLNNGRDAYLQAKFSIDMAKWRAERAAAKRAEAAALEAEAAGENADALPDWGASPESELSEAPAEF